VTAEPTRLEMEVVLRDREPDVFIEGAGGSVVALHGQRKRFGSSVERPVGDARQYVQALAAVTWNIGVKSRRR